MRNCCSEYLTLPIAQQINADRTRVYRQVTLERHAGTSLGLKVVGGKKTVSGRLGAFITKVKRGTVADTVGHLRPGDEVLEWNGQSFQNASFDEVYSAINASKHDPRIDLVIARDLDQVVAPPSLNQQLVPTDNVVLEQRSLPVSPISLCAAVPSLSGRAPVTTVFQGQTPVVMITTPLTDVIQLNRYPNSLNRKLYAEGQIFGQIQIGLLYSHPEQQLVVNVYQAIDLPPRTDGVSRNPYVKMFLLPDRSERSRRQSKVLANTCHPAWNQSLVYKNVTTEELNEKILEITVWDYEKYGSNEFLGELLIDLSATNLRNEPIWYTLTDVDEESAVRKKLRNLRVTTYLKGSGHMRPSFSSTSLFKSFGVDYSRPGMQYEMIRPHSSSGYGSDSGLFYRSLPRARISRRFGRRDYYRTEDRQRGAYDRLPLDLRPSSPTEELTADAEYSRSIARRLPNAPSNYAYDSDQQHRRLPTGKVESGIAPSEDHDREVSTEKGDQQQPYPPFVAENLTYGYLSDGSETSASIGSTQSERLTRKISMPSRMKREEPLEEERDQPTQYGSLPDSVNETPTADVSKQNGFGAVDKRKKSIMTRLIPGRAGGLHNAAEQKRIGFRRSDEVGIPPNISPQSSLDVVNHSSRESTDSNESSWLPPNKSLGEFVADLGPGQVVGRQVLASPCLGEIQLCMVERKENLEVKIVRARNLNKKPGAKYYPAPYVKVYLLDGKSCVAKAKTAVAARTPEPRFDQHLIFTAPYRGKILQITVMGDYGRMERRTIIGIAVIRLSSLDLSNSVEGWYKLFPTSAIIGPGQMKKDDPT